MFGSNLPPSKFSSHKILLIYILFGMSSSTAFTKSVLKVKKQSKIKLLFLFLGRIIKNNPLLFFFCSLLAVIVAVINFNISSNVKNLILHKEKTLSEQV